LNDLGPIPRDDGGEDGEGGGGEDETVSTLKKEDIEEVC